VDQRETSAERLAPRAGPQPSAAGSQLLAEVLAGSYRRLVVQLYAATGDLAEAETVVQDAYVRAASAPTRFADVADPEAWLRATALDRHHHRSRMERFWPPGRRTRRTCGPVDLVGLEDHLELVRALRRLTPRERELLGLRDLSGLTVPQVAEALQVAEDVVESRLTRAHVRLDEALEAGEDDSSQ
jgi:RNA polymerase sigma-70 factor (ECF subfamily)